jgi:putative tryptophan/tyrosine transport system substrate-binding protein
VPGGEISKTLSYLPTERLSPAIYNFIARLVASNCEMKKPITAVTLCAMLFAICYPAEAQQAKRVYRVGYLSPRSGVEWREEAFRQGLRDLGYIEGQNLAIEWRFSKGKTQLFPELAAELVRLQLGCILAVGVSAVDALRQLTKTIPIVIGTIDADPVEHGFVASLARPGNNITGLTGIAYDIAGKRPELLKETVPKASRAAILVDPSPAADAHVRETDIAARNLRMHLQLLEVRQPEGLDNAFQVARQGRAEVLTVVATGLINSHRPRIINLAANSRLPTIYSSPVFVLEGGLMSYAADSVARSHRAATYVDKIFKGAKPADLPVEQPMKFEFVINLKTAKQIALTIPPEVLARADRVIR